MDHWGDRVTGKLSNRPIIEFGAGEFEIPLVPAINLFSDTGMPILRMGG
jgi:hypothetical protein